MCLHIQNVFTFTLWSWQRVTSSNMELQSLKCCKLYKIIIVQRERERERGRERGRERERLFNTRISLPVTLTGSEKVA